LEPTIHKTHGIGIEEAIVPKTMVYLSLLFQI